MNFVDNINLNPVASRNAADIVLAGISASKVNITVSVQSSGFTFVAEPYQGQLKIRLADILRSFRMLAFQEPPTPAAGQAATASAGIVTIEASASGEASPTPWSRTVFDGGYDSSLHSSLMNSYWWTWRDQTCRTFTDGREYLGALFLNGANGTVKVVATFQDGSTSQKTIATIGTSGDKFGIVDVSYSRMAALFSGNTVVSYKIFRGTSNYGQAYEVSDFRPARTFVFRNSLGLFDTVYATGHISTGADRDVKTFIGEDREENISDNNSRERIYVNSGRIDTKGGRTLWNEFVHSADAWEYAGGTLRKIVVDKFDSKLREAASGAITFEYHYSAEPAGGGYVKAPL